ncbi:MAG: serine/threonine-protein kinase [Halopseudomonas sp.]
MTELPVRYLPTGKVANGGFGSVSFCTDTNLDRLVAIKSIQDAQELSRLMDEISALMAMRSNHVVQVYDLLFDNDTPTGIIEEFISGMDLLESSEPQASIENYLRTLWQLAAGLSDIHAHGIIHRDIKPNNMKLDDEGVLKIFDFGLSRFADPDAGTVGFKGTFYFAAPELFVDGKVSFTQAVDVYAFGATACYLADKSLPSGFSKSPPDPAPADAFSSKQIGIPDELSSLFLECLAHDPVQRPSMAFVRDSIAKYLLKDKHQALAVFGNAPQYLNKSNKSVTLNLGNIGAAVIAYDGLRFYVQSVSGEVLINNSVVAANDEMPGSCVVALGAATRHYTERAFITFDISHPEVLL